MSQLHITIREGTELPPVQKCAQCGTYHCPLCSPSIFKPTHRYKVYKHLNSHFSRTIHFQGYNIYKCNLGCRPEAHFHCFCKKLFLNRNQFVHHLDTKHHGPPEMHSSVSCSVEDDEAGDKSAELLLPVNDAPLSPSSADQPNTTLSLTCPPISDGLGSSVASDETCQTSASDAPVKLCQAKAKLNNRVACPQCNLVTNRKSLSRHIQIKHSKGPINPPTVGRFEHRKAATPVELDILAQLKVLQQQQSRILVLLEKLTNTTDLSPDLKAMFPITDEDGLAALELKLSENSDLKNQLIHFFRTSKGFSINHTVEGILERMLSCTFAKRMNWAGEDDKVSFASSSLKEIVNDSVRSSSESVSAADAAVESAVQRWLLQAGQREEGRDERGGEKPEAAGMAPTP